MKIMRLALFAMLLSTACSSSGLNAQDLAVSDVASLRANIVAYEGKSIVITALVVPSRHGLLMTDSPEAPLGIPMLIDNKASKRKDIDSFLSQTRRRGRLITIRGTFTGTIVRNEDAPGWSFQLISVQEALELPASPETNQEHAPNPF